LKQVKAGSIILMHDGPSNRQQTAAALPSILAGLRARGLTPVTLPHLLANATGSSSAHTSNRATSTTSGKTTTRSGTTATKSGVGATTHSSATTAHPVRHCEHDGDHDADDNC